MSRFAIAGVGAIVLALGVAACESESSPSGQGRAGAGAQGDLEGSNRPDPDSLPTPGVEPGVVPELVGTSLGKARVAIEEAGFKEGEIEGGIGAGNVFPETLVICEQDPEPGSEPKKGTPIDMVGMLECPA